MQDRQLQYLIKVVDQATANITKVANELQRLETQNSKNVSSASSSGTSVLQMAAAFGIATTAVGAIQQGMQFLNNQLDNSVKAANQYTSAFIGLSSVAAAFGESQDKARAAAKDLASDGLMTVTDAANSLKNLLGSKFNLDESINLMHAFKDAAAFNRQGTLEFGQAIVGATQGIKNQNSIMVDNVGITKNLSIILQEAGYSVMDLQHVTTDAGVRQALYNGLLREGAVFSGDAGRAAQTLSGSQSQLNTEMQYLYNTVGQTLTPAIILLNEAMTGTAASADASIKPMMTEIAKDALIATESVLMLGSALKNVSLMVGEFASAPIPQNIGDLLNPVAGLNGTQKGVDAAKQQWSNYGKEVGKIYGDTQKGLDQIAQKGIGSFANVTRDALDAAGDVADKNGAKIAKKLEEIAAKIADINRNMAEESTAFARNEMLASQDFDSQMSDIIAKHKQTLEDIKSQIADLNSSYSDSAADRLSSYNDKVDEIKKKYADETATLQLNLSKQMGSSKTASTQLVKYFQAQIDAKNKQRDIDIANEKASFDKQEAKEKAAYDKQMAALQTKLNAEMDIEKKHADEFAKFKDAVVEDDITRAEKAFQRQMDQMKYQHDLKMKELERQLQEEQALKDKYLGTGVSSGSTYKSSGTTNSYQGAQSQSKSYTTNNNSSVILNLNGNQSKSVSNDIKAILPTIGFLLK